MAVDLLHLYSSPRCTAWVIHGAGRFSRFRHPHPGKQALRLECAQQLSPAWWEKLLGPVKSLTNIQSAIGVAELASAPAPHLLDESVCAEASSSFCSSALK